MKWSALTLARKLWLSIGTAIAFVAALVIVVYYAFSSTEARFSRLIDHEFTMIQYNYSAKILFLECRRAEKEILYNDDDSVVKKINDFSAKMLDEIHAIDGLSHQVADDGLIGISSDLTKSGEDYRRLFQAAVAVPPGQARLAASIPMRKAANEVESKLNSLLDSLEKRIRASREETQRYSRLILALVIGCGALAMAVGCFAAIVLSAAITGPLKALLGRITALAAGDLRSDVPFASRGDEIGKLAASVELFKTSIVETEQLRFEQRAQEERQLARAQRIDAMITQFETTSAGIVESVATSASQLESTAVSMESIAREATQHCSSVARISEKTTSDVETVSSATEELSTSISKINDRVVQSTQIAGSGSRQASETNQRVVKLRESVEKIGAIVDLISNITARTNLLALNATIEAARAGEAGKGFSVVALEVKALATQTAKATEEIATQVRDIQDETAQSVGSIETITGTINEIHEISKDISAAIESQNVTTREIAGSAAEAAHLTREVVESIANLTDASRQTGSAAAHVLEAAKSLSLNGERLTGQIEDFLREVRAA